MVEIRGIQQALGQMCLSSKTTEAPEAMIVAPPSPDRASVFSVCFPKKVLDYDLPMDLGNDTNRVTLLDTSMDEIDMIDTGHILDTAPHGPHYAFDMFGVSMINTDDVILYDACIDAMDMIGIGRILDASIFLPCRKKRDPLSQRERKDKELASPLPKPPPSLPTIGLGA